MGNFRIGLVIVSLLIIVTVALLANILSRQDQGDDAPNGGAGPSISARAPSSEAPARSSPGIPTDSESQADSWGDRETVPAMTQQVEAAPDLAESLAAERVFLTMRSQIDTSEVQRHLQSDGFSEVVEQLASESMNSAEARELAEIYSDVMQSAIAGALDGAVLEEFACGLRICLGTAEFTGGNAELLALSRWMREEREGPPIYVFMPTWAPHPHGRAGRSQLRLLLSTDPESNSATLPLP